MPAAVERIMTEGVVIQTVGDDELDAHEVSQYPFRDGNHFTHGSQECDRALLCGHLEPVPADLVECEEGQPSLLEHGLCGPT
jgi:hypothetical protein